MSELLPCPVCGFFVQMTDREPLLAIERYAVGCQSLVCDYSLADDDEAKLVEFHNALARRAEIGRLVEAITAAQPVMLGVLDYIEWLDPADLVGVLHALAAKLGVTNGN